MKKLYILVLFVSLASLVSAQRTVNSSVEISKNFNFSLAKEITDTIMPAGWDMDSVITYSFNDANGNFAGYVAGINTYADLAKVQQYNADTATYKLHGGLMLFGQKFDLDTINTNNGGFDFCLYNFVNSTPTTVNKFVPVAFEQIDTLGFTVALFDTAVEVTGTYGIGINMAASFTETSILTVYGLMTSRVGMGGGLQLAWEQWSDGDWYKMDVAWQGFNADLGIFPVVEIETIGIEEMAFINGLKVNAYPNPSTDLLNVEYSIQNSANVTISLVNMNGQIIRQINQGNLISGNHNAQIEVSELASGNYFLAIQAGTQRIAQRIAIR
jgi:hypothetical protein